MKKLLLLPLAAAATVSLAADAPLQRCRGLADDRARLACYDAIPVPVGPTAGIVPPVAASTSAQGFGLPSQAAPAEAVRSRVVGHFDGWEPKTVLQLENGQHWQIADGSRAAYLLQSPQVEITRSAISGYLMVVEGVAQRPRVRRVK